MDTITHFNEPYGTVVFTEESVEKVTTEQTSGYMFNRMQKGWVMVRGTVVSGSEKAFLLGAVSSRDLSGQPYTLSMPKEAYEAREYRTIAM